VFQNRLNLPPSVLENDDFVSLRIPPRFSPSLLIHQTSHFGSLKEKKIFPTWVNWLMIKLSELFYICDSSLEIQKKEPQPRLKQVN